VYWGQCILLATSGEAVRLTIHMTYGGLIMTVNDKSVTESIVLTQTTPSSDTATEWVSTYKGANKDGWLNMFRLDTSKLESSYRLYHGNKSSVSLMKKMGSKDKLGKKWMGLLFVNDMSVAIQPKLFKDSVKARSFKDADGNVATFGAAAIKQIQAYMDSQWEEHKDDEDSQNASQIKRELHFGKVVGYMNLFLFKVVDGVTVIKRVPGSKALRSKSKDDKAVLRKQGGLRDKNDNLIGEEVLVKFNWHDSKKNTHVDHITDDWSEGEMLEHN